jgi:dethiobiotin synthetase
MSKKIKLPDKVFIAGTDTDIGKTLMSAALVRYYIHLGLDVTYVKPIQTGYVFGHNDEDVVRKYSSNQAAYETWYTYALPASPHLAAVKDNKRVPVNQIIHKIKKCCREKRVYIFEGAGGLFVPLNRRVMTIDIIEKTHLPVILVSKAGLGTLNHTLLSIEALYARKIPVSLILFTELKKSNNIIVKDNIYTIQKITGIPCRCVSHLTETKKRLFNIFD